MPSNFKIYRALRPLSWLYRLAVNFRNGLYFNKKLKSRKFDFPIICVGNITAGGTGKTPHTEYLIQLLSPQYKVAVLSRGYKRKSKGFRIVEVNSTVEDVGDEPLQIKQKFPDTLVVVDKNRIKAIEKILSIEKENRPDVILLDDGFQYLKLQPSISIVLINSNRPVFDDELLPAGLLREPVEEIRNRSDLVVVTKCREDVDIFDYQAIYDHELNLYPHQMMFFTTLEYGNIKPVFSDFGNEDIELIDLIRYHVFLVAGIASPQPLIVALAQRKINLYTQFFPDHHFFTEKDVKAIQKQFDSITDCNKIILTTEKDTVRFRTNPFLSEEVKKKMYYIPIQVIFLDEETKKDFDMKVLLRVEAHKFWDENNLAKSQEEANKIREEWEKENKKKFRF
jgi:tetraacyldisaccharide 4'-kinase